MRLKLIIRIFVYPDRRAIENTSAPPFSTFIGHCYGFLGMMGSCW